MNVIVDCEQLEAYLDGDLSAAEAAAFQSHLSSCEDCQSAVGEQQWIDDLLRSPQVAALEPAPAYILTTLAAKVSRRRRRALLTKGLAAAAVAVIAYWGIFSRHVTPERPVMAVAEPVPAIQARVSPAVFVAEDGSIAVPVASDDPNVTIVRMYAAYRPATSRRRKPRPR